MVYNFIENVFALLKPFGFSDITKKTTAASRYIYKTKSIFLTKKEMIVVNKITKTPRWLGFFKYLPFLFI